MSSVSVLLPLPFEQGFDYETDRELLPGQIVTVPFGATQRPGVVWPRKPDWAAADPDKMKAVAGVADLPPLPSDLITLVERVAAYTLSPLGSVLRLALSPSAIADPPAKPHLVRRGEAPAKLTDARRRVLEAAADGLPRTVAALAREAAVGEGVVRGLVKAGTFETLSLAVEENIPQPDPSWPAPALRPEQAAAATALREAVRNQDFAPLLLEGVTGAGKTEVYFEAISQALRQDGGQVLVLLPEIALTAQWLDRFAARFGCPPLVWHSGLSPAERRRTWRAVIHGQARVVVGARSALFLPFPHLSLIVVDEEHDPSFKQEEGVFYHARDMAVWRASLASCPVALVSATPSLETRLNVRDGRYAHWTLAQRHGRAVLPRVDAVDLRADSLPPGEFLSLALQDAISSTLEAGEQSLLFLNRRGYAPLTLCRSCGARFECPDCSAWLVEHRYHGRLECHHCGYWLPTPNRCFECGAEDSLVACGPGVERLAEEVLGRWPDARLAVMASDTVGGPAQMAALVEQVARGEVDILIGTQLVAKGYHFPKLTLVGVVDADLGLRGGDLRAGERTYQQLVQVAGRAGREDRPGRVLLQSFDPNHPVVQALVNGQAERFLRLEEEARRTALMPPFARLAGVIISGPDLARVNETGQALARAAPRPDGVDIWGPVPAPLAKLRGRHRVRFLVRCEKSLSVQRLIRAWLDGVKIPHKVQVKVDIDPMSFL